MRLIGTIALATLAAPTVAGQVSTTRNGFGPFAVFPSMMKGCDSEPKKSNIAATLKIFLPEPLSLANIRRNVKIKDYQYDELESDNATKDSIGPDNNLYNLASQWRHPFDIEIKETVKNAGQRKYIAIHVIKRQTNVYSFNKYPFYALLSDNKNSKKEFCFRKKNGSFEIVSGDPDERQVARFFIDIKKYNDNKDKNRSFSIGVEISSFDETPIFIDPKVRHEG